MAIDFPSAPVSGQTYTSGVGTVWQWDGTKWVPGGSSAGPTISVGDTPPAAPAVGTLWFDSASGQMFVWYADQNSVQWVPSNAPLQSTPVASGLGNVGRNLVHNPLFNVAQRGAGPWSVSGYTLDRWQVYANLDTMSVSQQQAAPGSGAPGDDELGYYLRCAFTGNAGAAAETVIYQQVENVRRLSGKTVTVSFYALAFATPLKLGVSFDQNFGTGGSPSATVNGTGQSISLTTGWVRYSLTFTVPSISGKTLGTNGDHKTILNIWCSGGTNLNFATGSIGVQSGTIQLWGVQLEAGTQATALEKIDPRNDLANCQRFYQTFSGRMDGYQLTNGYVGWTVALPVTMRATPAVVPSFAGSGNASNSTVNALSAGAVQIYCQATATGGVINNVSMTLSADL